MNPSYISLHEASKLTPYDANYIGLLIRKKRLHAIKQGGKWYTTKDDVRAYLERVSKREIAQALSNTIPLTFRTLSTISASVILTTAFATFMFAESVAASSTFKVSDDTSIVVPLN